MINNKIKDSSCDTGKGKLCIRVCIFCSMPLPEVATSVARPVGYAQRITDKADNGG